MNINIIGVPLFYGCDKKGVDLAPNKLRERNIISIIEKNNHKVFDLGNIYVPETSSKNKYLCHNKMKYLNEVITVNTNLAEQVYHSTNSKRFPIIIGGDHSIGLGSISGISKTYDNLAVVWIDAHGDINTHVTTPSGNIHGMPLAAAMGMGHTNLTELYYDGIKVKPENVFIIGARDLDEGELKLIKDRNLNIYTMEDIKNNSIEYIMKIVNDKLLQKNIDAVHLSFDIDCLDSKLVPGTGTPVCDGMSIEECKFALKSLLETKLIKSLDFVELNTELDNTTQTIDLCVDLINWITKHIK
ncbi:arginase [Haloimpatiens sp. FM7330]|uniref:arginase n=1 Tax=Haloimpatiens sp. FM7330 TaxID=3298610 RepID=UPI00362FEBE9